MVLSPLTIGPEPLSPTYQQSVLDILYKFENNFQVVFPNNDPALKFISILWPLLVEVYNSESVPDIEYLSRSLKDQIFIKSFFTHESLSRVENLLNVLIPLAHSLNDPDLGLSDLIGIWFDPDLHGAFLGINDYKGITWFNKESFERLLDLTILILYSSKPRENMFKINKDYYEELIRLREDISKSLGKSDYQVDSFRKTLKQITK